MLGIETAHLAAIGRLCVIAKRDTSQSRRVADFLLAWYHAAENGGIRPTCGPSDRAVAEDMLTVLVWIAAHGGQYPNDVGFEPDIEQIWRLWRGPKA